MPTYNMRVLGIDPGIELAGFGLIDAQVGLNPVLVHCGVIRTSSMLSTEERLVIIAKDLQDLIDQSGDIDVAGIEELFFAKNVTTAFTVGQARGVIMYILAKNGIPIVEVKPVEVKQALTGSGRADKKEMQRMVQFTFGLDAPPRPDDAADAAAVALTALASYTRQKQEG